MGTEFSELVLEVARTTPSPGAARDLSPLEWDARAGIPDDHANGTRLRPRVWLIEMDDGTLCFPATAVIADVDEKSGKTHAVDLHNDKPHAVDVGGFEARVYQGARQCTVVQVAPLTLPDGRDGMLAIAWCLVPDKRADTPFWSAVEKGCEHIVASWECDIDSDELTWLVTALDDDASKAAAIARENWPANWRMPVKGDLPDGPPTGARIVGAAIAS